MNSASAKKSNEMPWHTEAYPAPTKKLDILLDDARSEILPYLRDRVDRLAPPMKTVAAYHFGWVNKDGTPRRGRSGKYLRAALAIATTSACGIPKKVGLRAAAAVELVHNFSLIHDDIMDGDASRRGRPTAWSAFGIPLAVLTGDGLLAAAYKELIDERESNQSTIQTIEATRLLAATVQDLIVGQALDLDFETRGPVVTRRECRRMHDGKTGALLACASALGATAGGADPTRIDALSRLGMYLGRSFQAWDDILGIWGDPETTGKPKWNDLRNGKKTLPVVTALNAGGPASEELRDLMSRNDWHTEPGMIARSVHLIEAAGGRDSTMEEAEQNHQQSLAALKSLAFHHAAHTQLTEIIDSVINRKF
ncbi:polyprenyl synthetase family protein [Streptomyces sp. NPDC058701]|uniref:polyprenyl synthetase family protein n=1 Tax=Streptomyces sp. NPDC058701 TaxID=3346608 RepID=UPI0036693137